MKRIFYNTVILGTLIMVITLSGFSQPITFTVNSTGDAADAAPGDGVCLTANNFCTLRAAMQEANFNTGFHDFINFNISSPGIQTIAPGTQLPTLSDNSGVTIDGSTQPGASIGANPPSSLNLLIELKGQGYTILPPPPPPLMHGILIMSDNNDIRGLIINEFTGDGIRIEGTTGSTDNNLIYANIVGTDPGGVIDRGNATSSSTAQWYEGINIIVPPCEEIPVFASNNIVRRNLISGNGTFPPPMPAINRGEGVSITNCPPGDNGFNTVEYNYIGTDLNGIAALGNDSDGVTIAESAHDNLIDHNVISANGYSGVGINGLPSPQRFTINNTISNNIIGLDRTATSALGNGFQGVSIGRYGPNVWGFARSNSVTNNVIAHNTMNGILIEEHSSTNNNGDFNLISQNSIYSNGQLGIDLVTMPAPSGTVTPNDPGDPDSGPNDEINFPVINSATISGSNTTISGTVDIPSPTTSTIEIFKAATDPTGFGEGMTYIGSTTPSAIGNWSLTTSVTISTSDMLTGTSFENNGNSSEFSQNLTPVLPAELISWEVRIDKGIVSLSWTTASEINNKGFSIQKSYDGISWNELFWMSGKGGSAGIVSYYYEDNTPFMGDNYYRLMQVDYDENTDYSEVKYIFYESDVDNPIHIFPNPSSGSFQVHIMNANREPVSLSIYDIMGRKQWSRHFKGGEMPKIWRNSFELPDNQVYILRMKIGSLIINRKIVVSANGFIG